MKPSNNSCNRPRASNRYMVYTKHFLPATELQTVKLVPQLCDLFKTHIILYSWQMNLKYVKYYLQSKFLFINFSTTPSRMVYLDIVSYFFFFLKSFCLDQGPFCGANDCSWFGLCVSFLMDFKSRADISPALFLACVLWSWRSQLVWHLPFPPIGVYTV